MGMGLVSTDAERRVATPFLVKTYRLVDDPSTDHIVSWGDRNNTFVVWHPKEFSASLLPSYFNHTNFSSFVRQLNTYGFRKIGRGRCEFANELFRKGQEHLLSHIQRRKPSTSLFSPMSSTQQPDVAAAAPSLSEENEILRRNNSLLLSEIARLKNICIRDMTLFIRHNARDALLADMDRKIDNVTVAGKEISMTPPKLFGVPLN